MGIPPEADDGKETSVILPRPYSLTLIMMMAVMPLALVCYCVNGGWYDVCDYLGWYGDQYLYLRRLGMSMIPLMSQTIIFLLLSRK